MARSFEIPDWYRSSITTSVKLERRAKDARKRDLSPSILDRGNVRFKLARHFGFCFGVENAIETAFRALSENPEKRLFLLSEMIHNPMVNNDLVSRGVKFLFSTEGNPLIALSELRPDDMVIVPAFGTTLELMQELRDRGIDPTLYNATCPFVEKVWNRAAQLGAQGYTIVIHGKHFHEETRATFSHARKSSASVIVRDMVEAERLASYLHGRADPQNFAGDFAGKFSEGFDPHRDLVRIGVVNQTTMLAHETQAITDYLKQQMSMRYGDAQLSSHFADTRDTLCYATEENQQAVRAMVASGGDVAIVIGGYKSSNTAHLAKLCAESVPTFHIQDAAEIISADQICHMEFATRSVVATRAWLPSKRPLEVLLTAGASSPDALVDQVIERVVSLCGECRELRVPVA